MFDFLKKLFSGEKSLDSLQETIENKLSGDSNEEKKDCPTDEGKAIRQVTMGKYLYRVKGDTKIEVSKNDGKKWELYSELPIYCEEIKVSDDNKLMVLGSRDYNGIIENVKDSWAIAKEDLVTQAMKDKDEREFWATRDRWYKLDGKGNLSVAKDPNHPDSFLPLESFDEKMRIDEKDCYVRVYKMCPRDTFYSHDGIKWEDLGELPADFKMFLKENGIVYALDVEGNKSVYDGGWALVKYKCDMELFEDDDLYDEIDKVYYKYDDDGEKNISKIIHLLFLQADIIKIGIEIVYISDEGELSTHSSLPGLLDKLPENVHSCFGEVVIAMPNKKRYVYCDGKWRETGNWENCIGPFCFKAKIEAQDSFWDKVDTPIEEDDKGNPIRRPIYYKIPKNNKKMLYYSSDGKTWSFHSKLPEEFQAVTSTDYECHAMAIGTIVYTKKKHHYHWALKKKGLISKTYYNEWEKFDEGKLLEKVKV